MGNYHEKGFFCIVVNRMLHFNPVLNEGHDLKKQNLIFFE